MHCDFNVLIFILLYFINIFSTIVRTQSLRPNVIGTTV
jgi:hypothetical protein